MPRIIWMTATSLALKAKKNAATLGQLTYLPVMHRLFHTAPVGLEAWFHSLLVGLAVFALVEFEKWARHRRGPLAAADS